ncbi:MAG: putative PEP-binding protein [Candidatus Altiarchaeota archaeon]
MCPREEEHQPDKQPQRPPPPKVEEVAGRPPVAFGESPKLGHFCEARVTAPQWLHVKPSGTLHRVHDYFRRKDEHNGFLIPCSSSPEGNADKSSGWQDMSSKALVQLHVESGHYIDLMAAGPNARELMSVVLYAFGDGQGGFSRKSLQYIELFEHGQITLVDETTAIQVNPLQQGLADLGDLPRLVGGRLVLRGSGARSGKAVLGKAVRRSEDDYTTQFRLCDQDELPSERARLEALEKVMTRGRVASSGWWGVRLRLQRTDREAMLSETRDAEGSVLAGFLHDAVGLMSRPLDQQTLDAHHIPLRIADAQRVYPNAPLALDIAFETGRYLPGERETLDELRRTLMHNLVGGLDITDTMAYILHRVVAGEPGRPSFRRSGIYLVGTERVENSTEVRFAETRFELKGDGFSVRDRGARIPLGKEGDGICEVIRMASEVGRQTTIVAEDVSRDPRTNKGHVEFNICAFTSITGPQGEVLGAIWADLGSNEGEMTHEMVQTLEGAARETGELLAMTKTVSRPREQHKGDIRVSQSHPVADHVLKLLGTGWDGLVSRTGAKSHGLVIAGANRIPSLVVGRGVDEIKEGDLMLIVDPADSTEGLVVIEPDQRTLGLFGLRNPGDYVSIEPEPGEIFDAATKDGFRVHLRGTLQGTRPEQLRRFTRYGAEGAGLVRLELVMMNDPPTFRLNSEDTRQFEEELRATGKIPDTLPRTLALLEDYTFEQGAWVLHGLSEPGCHYPNEPVTIRLDDLTAGKYPPIYRDAFGDEAIVVSQGQRFLLEHPSILIARAAGIQRAAALPVPEVKIMVSNTESAVEFAAITDMLDKVEERARRLLPNVGHLRRMAQIEKDSPDIFSQIRTLADYADGGFAIGTNDFTMWTLRKRGREALQRNDEFTPEVLARLHDFVEEILSTGSRACVCGCLAESDVGALLLVGLGVDEISAPARCIPRQRRVLRLFTTQECVDLAQHAISHKGMSGDDVYTHIQAQIKAKEDEARRA